MLKKSTALGARSLPLLKFFGTLGLVSLAASCSDPDNINTNANVGNENLAEELSLPLSLNAVMVALTDRSAEPVWVATYEPPETQQDWDLLEYDMMDIAVSGVVITIPGTGEQDAEWVQQPEWRAFASQMGTIGMNGLTAVRNKDINAVTDAANELVLVCEGCHRRFKPDIPTQNIIMHSEYYIPPEDLRGN